MDTKKENPPHKKGFPFTTIIAILTGITSLLIFLTGKTNLPDIIKGDAKTETPTQTLTSTAATTDTPMVVLSPIPTEMQTQETSATPTLQQLLAQPPSDSDLETIPSLWTLTNFKELPEPGSNGYTVEVTHDSVWLWDCYFCTTDDTFQTFLATLKLEFLINDVPLKEESFRVYDRPGIKGWLCRNWSTRLSGWPPDRSVFLEIHYRHTEKAYDGKDEFAAGEYSQLIVVVVKG